MSETVTVNHASWTWRYSADHYTAALYSKAIREANRMRREAARKAGIR